MRETPEERQKLIQAGKLVKQVYPGLTGSVKFNLHAKREKVNMNVEYSLIIQPNEYFGGEQEPNK